MNLASISENLNVEKRIAVTPEIAKKFITLGFNLSLPKNYNRKIAIKTRTKITAVVPQRKNLVKLFHVFLWFSLSIKLLLSCFKFRVCFIYYVDSSSSPYKLRVKVSFFYRFK